MKKILSFLVVTGLCFSLSAFDVFSYAPVAGRVKSYTETIYNVAMKFGSYVRTPNKKITHSFDNFGREYDSQETTARGKVLNQIESIYDDNGILKSQKCINDESEILWESEITYKNGIKTDISEYNGKHELAGKIIYTYEENVLTDESSYDSEGALEWKTIYKYNEDGKTSVESTYYGDGTLDQRKAYTYTEDGKVDSITTFDSFSTEITKQIFRYGSNGLLNEITAYNKDNVITSRIVIKYDAKGNPTRVSEYQLSFKFDTTVTELINLKEISYVY